METMILFFIDEVKVGWIENMGNGTFSTPHLILSIPDLSCMASLDMDNDNDIDLVLGGNSSSGIDLIWLENNGSNTFSTPDTIKTGAEYIRDVTVDDFDGDGDMDIATASSSGAVHYFENDGSLSFMESLVSNHVSYNVLMKDIDGDNDMDIAATVANYPSGVVWYENTGTSSFTPHNETFPEIGNSPDLHFEDFNGDAIPDLIFSGSDSPGLINWKESLSAGNFSDIHEITSLSHTANESELADLDGDGDLDAISMSSKQIFWNENLGSGTFSNVKKLYTSSSGSSILRKSLNVFDIDYDGDMDILASQNSYDRTVLCRNDGNGNFTIELAHTSGHYNFELAYIDNDTLVDIIYTDIAGDEVGWRKNQGNGVYTTTIINSTLNGPDEIIARDIDNDGDNDIVVSVAYDHKIGWFENTGNGIFSAYQDIEPNSLVKSIHISDLNKDNQLDIIAILGNDELVWYKNLGSATFTNAIQIDFNSNNDFNQVFSDDIDGDGDIDIMTSALRGAKYFLNADTGAVFTVFDMAPAFGSSDYSGQTFSTGDIDNDGDIDILSCGRSSSNVFYYQNQFNSSLELIIKTCGSYTEPSGDSTYYLSTTIYDTIASSLGGDSALTIHLTILDNMDTTYISNAICVGDTFSFGGFLYSQAGIYTDTLANMCGLDSIVLLHLTVIQPDTTILNQSVCMGESILFNGNFIGSAGQYLDTLTAFNSCDSILLLNLSVIFPDTTILNEMICAEDSFLFNQQYLSSAGQYLDTLITSNGCDSFLILNLSITDINTNVDVSDNILTGVYQDGASYQWLNCDDNFSSITGETDSSFTATNNGSYALQVEWNGCVDTSSCSLIQGIGMEESIHHLIKTSPNPSTGELTRFRI